ncbi:MAG: LysR family transcriptional regulator [Acidovorax sp.]|jgi:DNA-binding transcriptional LysR family regulator|nr:LysR family transcriptional regulator [Acidovorax sp.]
MIDSRLLRAFKAVAEELHFGRAAQKLHMSQPPLSLSIRQLEELLDVPLFVRTTRHVQLTSAGAELLQRLPDIEAAYNLAIEAVRQTGLGMEGTLNVALTPTAAFSPIPLVLRRFCEQFPRVQLTLKEMNSRDMGQALMTGQIDLAIARPFACSDALRSQVVYREPMFLSQPMEDVKEGRQSVSLQEALQTRVIGYHSKDSHYFSDLLERLFVQADLRTRPTLLSMVPTILLLVESGMGTAIVPHSLTRLRGDTLTHLPISGIEHVTAELAAVHRSNDASACMHSFLRLLKEQPA